MAPPENGGYEGIEAYAKRMGLAYDKTPTSPPPKHQWQHQRASSPSTMHPSALVVTKASKQKQEYGLGHKESYPASFSMSPAFTRVIDDDEFGKERGHVSSNGKSNIAPQAKCDQNNAKEQLHGQALVPVTNRTAYAPKSNVNLSAQDSSTSAVDEEFERKVKARLEIATSQLEFNARDPDSIQLMDNFRVQFCHIMQASLDTISPAVYEELSRVYRRLLAWLKEQGGGFQPIQSSPVGKVLNYSTQDNAKNRFICYNPNWACNQADRNVSFANQGKPREGFTASDSSFFERPLPRMPPQGMSGQQAYQQAFPNAFQMPGFGFQSQNQAYTQFQPSGSQSFRKERKPQQSEVPKFDGLASSWRDFKEEFTAVVINCSLVEAVTAKRWLVEAVPETLKETIRVAKDCATAMDRLSELFEGDDKIHSEIVQQLKATPYLQDRNSQEELEKFRNTVLNLKHKATPLGDTFLREIHGMMAPRLNKSYFAYMERSNHKTLDDLLKFLEKRIETVKDMAEHDLHNGQKTADTPTSSKPKPQPYATSAAINKQPFVPACSFCGQLHKHRDCPLSRKDRLAALQQQSRCFGCLKKFANLDANHRNVCVYKCNFCQKKMHPQVCTCQEAQGSSSNAGSAGASSQAAGQPQKSAEFKPTVACLQTEEEDSQISILPTMTVIAENCKSGLQEEWRILLDSGSTDSFVSESVVAKLQLDIEKTRAFRTNVFGGQNPVVIDRVAEMRLRSKRRPNVYADVRMFVVPGAMLKDIPVPSDEVRRWGQERNIHLSEETQDGGLRSIDVIVGEDILTEHFYLEHAALYRVGKKASFGDTRFGWVFRGRASPSSHKQTPTCLFIATSQDRELTMRGDVNFTAHACACQDLMKLFLDPLTEPDSTQIVDQYHQQYYEKIKYDSTTKRFTCGIPWKSERRPTLNRAAITAQAIALKKRLIGKGELDEYDKVVDELVNSGHAEMLDGKANLDEGHYIAHFGVRKKSSTTTPLRQVFIANRAAKGEPSLNDTVYKGVWQHPKLAEILIRFRTNPFAMLVDLKKAFLQIRISEEDRKFLRFVWFKDNRLRVFQMTSLLFGAASSPHVLHAVLRRLFELFAPDLIEKLRDVYMDDALLTADTIDGLRKEIQRFGEILDLGSFSLHKWTTTEFLAKQLNVENKSGLGNVLGVQWDLQRDLILFAAPSCVTETLTRRVLTSEFGRVWDPLGLLGPNQTRLKILLRDVTTDCKEWDKQLPEHFQERAKDLLEDFQFLKDITLSRNIRSSSEFELWSFGDASKIAYGACIYVHDLQEKVTSLLTSQGHLPSSKTKSTIPQLELNAAVLLAQMLGVVLRALDIKPQRVRHFTDSQVTLHRILGDTNSQDRYVSGRVTEILRHTSVNDWYYIPTQHNPADIISRGASLQELKHKKLWFEGPTVEVIKSAEQQMATFGSVATISRTPSHPDTTMEQLVAKLSYKTFQSFVRRMMGFIDDNMNIQKRFDFPGEELSMSELSDIRTWQIIQKVLLEPEMPLIRSKDKIPKSSPLYGQELFFDQYGLVRTSSRRIDYANVDYEIKFPLVLKDHQMARSYIRRIHETKAAHSGAATTEHHVRLFVFLPNLSRITREVVKDCLTCRRYRTGKPFVAPTAPLPSDRCTSGFAFKAIGLDIFGPVLTNKKENSKFYGIVFICARSRAVHIEVIDSRETQAIMNAFHRFSGIYGTPELIRSDNELGFHRMAKTIKAVYERFKEDVHQWKGQLDSSIEWIFQPPAAPWWGSFWERLIGSVKRAMSQIRLHECTTYSQLETLMRQVQAFVNSRPLLKRSGEFPLTPAHLVFGRALDFLPPVKFHLRSTDISLVEYTLFQKSLDAFWKLFLDDYLTQLREHYLGATEAPMVREMVIIADNNQPRYRWELGVISKLFQSKDGAVRVAEVSLLDGKTMRTRVIQRLIPVERDLVGENMAERPKRLDLEQVVGPAISEQAMADSLDESSQLDGPMDPPSEDTTKEQPEMDEPDETAAIVEEMVLRSGRVLKANKPSSKDGTGKHLSN